MAKPKYEDTDSTPDFLDLPDIKYDNGHRPATGKALDDLADPEWRKQHGLGPLPPLPPPVDH